MARKITVMVIPEGGGAARSWKVSTLWLRVGLWLAAAGLLIIAAGAVSYGLLARKALQYNLLLEENRRLEADNRRIAQVARQVEQSRRILAQIIRSLGGKMDLSDIGTDTLAVSLSPISGGEEPAQTVPASIGLSVLKAFGLPTLMPVDGFITRGFSEDFLFPERSHRGIDIAARTGTPVLAAAAGRVIFAGWTPYYGNCLILAHPDNYQTFYGHNHVNLMGVGQSARRGEPIALLGNSGRSSAPHLHFEIWKDGVPVDPKEFMGEPSK